MKRIFLFLTLFLGCIAWAFSDHNKTIENSRLPLSATTFIQKHFPSTGIRQAAEESDYKKKGYTVWLENGIEIEFDRQGEWKEINSNATLGIPEAIVPAEILDYVRQQYPQNKITNIEKQKRGEYEIELDNGVEITFNRHFKVIDIDR